jgi:Immunoglobulin domain/Fibronectin type III domain
LDLSGSTPAAISFASGISSPVDLQLGPDAALYYLARGSGGLVSKIEYGAAQAPAITQHPSNQTVAVGQQATFSVLASGAAPLSFQWQRNGSNITKANSPSYTTAPVSAADNGARFRCIVSNALGSITSNEATLTVAASGNTAPTPTITQPPQGTLYNAGDTIPYAGTGTDPEDGQVPASRFTWQVDFHHDTHTHPFIPATTGATGGSFVIPNTGETSANVWYRIYLTVTDSQGAATTTFRDVLPRTVTITLATQPSGLQLTLDGQPLTAPVMFTGVVGFQRTIGAPSPQAVKSVAYTFAAWSDGGPATHQIATPPSPTTYTASYQSGPTPPAPPTNLVATAGNTTVGLSWTASSGASSYNVRRSTTNKGPYATIATGITTTGFTDTGLINGVTYYYVVQAVNSVGTSGNSNQGSATPH